MIRHIVMWKLKDEALGKTKKENIAIIKERLYALKPIIPEILSMEVHENVNDADAVASDAVLIMDAEDLEALERYKNHPEHKKVSSFVKEVRISRTAVDYII